MFFHMMAANKFPEMAITEPEALELARAYVGWRKHYGYTLVDPKTEALLTLIIAFVLIEGTRIGRVAKRVGDEKRRAAEAARAAKAHPGGTVVPLHAGSGIDGL